MPPDSSRHDSLARKVAIPMPPKEIIRIKQAESAVNKQANQLREAARSKVKQAADVFGKSLEKVKPRAVKIDLSLEEAVRYQPMPVVLTGYSTIPRQANVFSVQGTIQAFGIPLNVSYSNDRANIAGLNSMNNLFKFDFNPAQFTDMFKSDLEQYYEVRRNALGGLDLSGYTRNAVMAQLKKQESAIAGKIPNQELSRYLNDPANVSGLLNLNEEQMRQKLTAVAQSEAKQAIPVKELNPASLSDAARKQAEEKIKAEEGELQKLANDPEIKKYLSDPRNLQQLKEMSREQQLQQLSSLAARPATGNAIDSVARTITRIKESLQKNGVDVGKLQQIQKMLDSGKGAMPSTEQAAALSSKKAGTGIQSLFSKVQALKIGSFGNQVPGGIQGQDLFMDGTHITYKVGSIPLTAGYGSSNDIGSVKDAGYQSSVYSSPKTITYLGAQIRRGVFGNVKIAMVSSFGSDVRNAAIGIPATSSNNVAFTISKDMRMGKLGHLSVDVSKSTTLYNNNYQIGSDAILAQKAGINLNTTGDLFQAVGFGFNHQLELKELGLSDDIYFNYTGMGYQNPGNNGYGGARKKLGGSIKKTFYKNKLVLNLRTGLSGMPISYTTADQWRSYQVQLDSRYAVSKKFNLSLKYTANGTSKQVDEVVTPVYSFQKLQVDGNLSYKIGKNFTVSHFSIGRQDYSNATDLAMAGGGSMLTATYTQSMVINKNSLTATLFYNKELTPNSLIGNMFNSDMSYQYTLFNKLNLSSGLTYLNNAGIASQAGIRQGVQLLSSRHFDLSSYADLRKNLITPLYPDLYSACRAELSLKYHISN